MLKQGDGMSTANSSQLNNSLNAISARPVLSNGDYDDECLANMEIQLAPSETKPFTRLVCGCN